MSKYGEPWTEAERRSDGCPCVFTLPCDPRCTCVTPGSSVGCQRCNKYGSNEQRKERANQLAAAIAAMSGIPDPAAFIVAVEKAIILLESMSDHSPNWMVENAYEDGYETLQERANKALDVLRQAKGEAGDEPVS